MKPYGSKRFSCSNKNYWPYGAMLKDGGKSLKGRARQRIKQRLRKIMKTSNVEKVVTIEDKHARFPYCNMPRNKHVIWTGDYIEFCFQNDQGKLFTQTTTMCCVNQVNYCPFCGYKAPTQIGD